MLHKYLPVKHAVFKTVLFLIFLEDGNSNFLLNIGKIYQATRHHVSKHVTFHNHSSGNLSLCLFLNIKQLDALNFIMSLFEASTCFEHMCSSSGGQKLYYTVSGIIDTRDCIIQFLPCIRLVDIKK